MDKLTLPSVATAICVSLLGCSFRPIIAQAQSRPAEVTSALPYPKMGMMLEKLQIVDKLGGQGVYVKQVEPQSEAERRGVKAGDIITDVNHQPVRTPQDVSDEFATVYRRRSKSVDINVFVSRNNDKREVRLFFTRDLSASNHSVEAKGSRRTEAQSPPSEATSTSPLPYPKMGMMIEKLQIGDNLRGGGVYIKQVEPQSEAERRGVKAGDIITEVNHRSVRIPQDASNEFATVYRQGGKSVDVNVFVSRNNEELEVKLFFVRDLPASNPSARSGPTPSTNLSELLRKDPGRLFVVSPVTAGAVSASSWKAYKIGTEVAFGELTSTQLRQMIERTPGAGLLAAETTETAAKLAYSVAKGTIAKTPARWGLFFISIGSGLYATYQFWHGDTPGNVKDPKSADVTQIRELGVTSLPDLDTKQGSQR